MPLMMPFFGMPLLPFAGAVIFCLLVMFGVMMVMRRMIHGGCCFGCCCQNFSREQSEPQVTEDR